MSTKLTGRVVVPGDKDYNDARLDYNKRFSKYPKAIVFCQNDYDVINALKWARERGVPFRVRSGRHSYEAFSVLNGGIVIDVSEMNRIRVDLKKGIAVIEAGANLGTVYKELSKRGVVIPAGSEPGVGIAGLTLGGGIGFLSRKWGLTCDNLLRVQMVQAVGKTGARSIYASKKENADLFWASQGGGGGNFGIVTRFIFRVHPISTVAVYRITWDWEYLDKVFDAWQRWAPTTDSRLSTAIILNGKTVGINSSSGQFVGTEAELKRLLKPLLQAAPPQKVDIQTLPFIKAVQFFANEPTTNTKFKDTGSYVYKPLGQKQIQIMKSYLANTPSIDSFIVGLSLGGAIRRVPSNQTAYVHREAHYMLEYGSKWAKESEEQKNIAWVEGLRNRLLPYTVGNYVNWVDEAIQNYPEAYYAKNYKRLQQVKQKYDPYNVFRFQQSIRPPKS